MRITRVCAALGAAVGAAFLSLSGTAASAADFGYGSVKDIPPPPVASSRTWYLRGTIGMKNPEPGSIFINEASWSDHTVHHTDIKSTALFGFGIGVEANRWLRFDITGEYRGKQHFVAHDSYDNGGACPGVGCGTNDYSANLKSWIGLANAYIDLGTWRGVTPYVGGGIGMASIEVMGFKDVNPVQGSMFIADSNKTTTNFAWALYAGLAMDVTPQWTLDFGYRYTDLGSVKTGTVSDAIGVSPSYSGMEIRDIVSHDLLFTARYRLGSHEPMYPVAFK